MDEKEIMQTESVNEDENIVEQDEPEVAEQDTTERDPWDDDWDDLLDEKFESDNDDKDEDLEDGHQEDDAPAEEESAAKPDEEKTEEAEKPEEVAPKENAEAKRFHLKHLNEEIDVDESEVIKLAQKGMDYDFIRSEHDRLKAENARLKEADAFVNELAANSEQTVEQLIDSTRARLLVAKESKEGRTMGELEALQRVQRERQSREKAPVAPQAEEKPQQDVQEQKTEEQLKREKQQQIIKDFVREFPNLDPKTIPEKVLIEGFQKGNLINAVNKWQNDVLRSENEKLKLQQKNRARSTGSMKSSGAAKRKDPYDAGWYDDD